MSALNWGRGFYQKASKMHRSMSSTSNLFPGVRVILVEASHPGNVGSAARAMKNMGLTELVLVNPYDFPSDKAIYRAASAEDVVRCARVVDTVEEAIADCQLVIGTSARNRRIPWPMLTPKECGKQVSIAASKKKLVGLMFGRESKGLKNDELQKCNYHVSIPTGEAYTSLNLAMAVQVITYEIFQARISDAVSSTNWDRPLASAESMEHLYRHIEATLVQVKFHDKDNPRQLMTRIKRMFSRIQPDQMEVNILRGFLTAINKLGKDLS